MRPVRTLQAEGLDIASESATARVDEPPERAGRKPVPDEFYAVQLREHLAATDGEVPSARQVAQLLSIGQDRARRLAAMIGHDVGPEDQ